MSDGKGICCGWNALSNALLGSDRDEAQTEAISALGTTRSTLQAKESQPSRGGA